jgi:TPR repeat protein
MGYYYDNVEKNPVLAEKYYKIAAGHGYGIPFNNLGGFYRRCGKIELAKQAYLKSIELGNMHAFSGLASLYGGLHEDESANEYYIKGIEHGVLECYYNFGVFFENRNNYKMAAHYYQLTAEKYPSCKDLANKRLKKLGREQIK